MNYTFAGCSFTVGVGLEHQKHDVNNYANIVAAHHRARGKNIAVGGNSNYNIFMSALMELLDSPPDVLFVQWSELHRIWLHPGPDTKFYVSNIANEAFRYRDMVYAASRVRSFSEMCIMLNHDYNNLLTLVDYSTILMKLAGHTRIVFINGLIPWTPDILDSANLLDADSRLSDYTKGILEFDTRDDEEIQQYFTILSDKINTLDFAQWPNMFEALVSQKQDVGTDGLHPGIKSHQHYANMIINYLENT
jgi:hypothetical protein